MVVRFPMVTFSIVTEETPPAKCAPIPVISMVKLNLQGLVLSQLPIDKTIYRG